MVAATSSAMAQLPSVGGGQINGNVSILWQQYNEDSLIGATVPPEKTGFNAYANLIYTKGNFSAGTRFESYFPAILGYPGRFKGTGIGYRYARYQHQALDVTIGNFYDQFGSGLIFRSYEDRFLGIDNAMDGFRVIFNPIDGVYLKGIYGRQRLDFDSRLINGDGIIRGADLELSINDMFPALAEKKTKIILGGSYLSKYQVDNNSELILPENVASGAGRISIFNGGFNLFAEYVHKKNDPSADNGFIYKNGDALMVNAGWSKKGIGFNAGAKLIDNMSFRSDRNLNLLDLPINFIPAITKPHTYNLVATLYPYASVLNGEASATAEFFYKFTKDTPLGGKYGTNISVNFAMANAMDTTHIVGEDQALIGYNTNFFGMGDAKFVRDLNIELKKKFSKKFQAKYTYYYLEFNTEVAQVTLDYKGLVYADIHVLETKYKIKPKHSLRSEFQVLFTEQDKGDWGTVLIEYSWSPHWFFSVIDQYNYGNDDPDERIHYLFGTFGYINGSNRLSVGYGKRREGIFCVGGVCRTVPASNGLEISITSSF